MPTLVLTSDLHGNLPFKLPDGDILVIAGDLCPVYNHDLEFQKHWLESVFIPWLASQPHKDKVLIWGNHDFIGQTPNVPKIPGLLTDESAVVQGLVFWGCPWQLRFNNWAFNLDAPQLANKHERISDDVNVIVSHGPPLGYGDISILNPGENLGAKSLTDAIDRIRPELVVTGHIHSGYGRYYRGHTEIVNASQMNEQYHPIQEPIIVDLP